MENKISLPQVVANIWEVTKKYGLRVGGLLLIAYIGVACGSTEASINMAGANTNLPFNQPTTFTALEGFTFTLPAVGKNTNTSFKVGPNDAVEINGQVNSLPDGSFKVLDEAQECNVKIEERDGLSETPVSLTVECHLPPLSPTPIPSPRPSETPSGLLKGNGRLASQGNFHPGLSSKPTGRIRF